MTEIPEQVRRFIVEAIDSVPELEALLLLRSDRERTWSVDQAGARLYVSETVATHVLGSLAARGLLVQDDGRYRYAPVKGEVDDLVGDVATTYAASLIAVTRLIHSKPAPGVLEFANAFRLRKEP